VTSVPDADGGLGVEGLRDVRRFSHQAMNTVFEVFAACPDGQYTAQAAQAAFDIADRLERALSRFLPNSDVARINRLAAGESTQVGASTLECLAIARHIFDLTDGAFDVAIGTGLPSLEVNAEALRVRATAGDVRIDLGGIGKGYAVDAMAESLEEWDIHVALVHGGFSSVLALEPPAGCAGWPVTLSEPGPTSRVLERRSVRRTALGASGLLRGDHIIEPRRGVPVHGRRAAWVAVPQPMTADTGSADGAALGADVPRTPAAAVADALTTAAMLLTPEHIAAMCERHPGLEVWVLPDPASGPCDAPGLVHFGGGGPDAAYRSGRS
jgi:thiamine biosynthesis lipoprotein